jgi:hypothetical protein
LLFRLQLLRKQQNRELSLRRQSGFFAKVHAHEEIIMPLFPKIELRQAGVNAGDDKALGKPSIDILNKLGHKFSLKTFQRHLRLDFINEALLNQASLKNIFVGIPMVVENQATEPFCKKRCLYSMGCC